ncbi:SRPBCC family protein [Paenibacillus taichungensis]
MMVKERHMRGTITELEKPYVFGFGEVDDLVNISLPIRLTMLPWAVNTAAGWHQCLDVLVQIIKGKPIQCMIIQLSYVKSIVK